MGLIILNYFYFTEDYNFGPFFSETEREVVIISVINR